MQNEKAPEGAFVSRPLGRESETCGLGPMPEHLSFCALFPFQPPVGAGVRLAGLIRCRSICPFVPIFLFSRPLGREGHAPHKIIYACANRMSSFFSAAPYIHRTCPPHGQNTSPRSDTLLGKISHTYVDPARMRQRSGRYILPWQKERRPFRAAF